jgi:uncharacterized protein YcaQ
MTPKVSRRAVTALFLERQHLDRPRRRRLTAAHLTRFVEDAGGLQLDTINVVERAHHLTLWSRFGPYDRGALDRLIYRRRALFEYWAHAACLVPASHGAAWRRVMIEYGIRPRPGWHRWVKKNRAVIEHVLEQIRSRGPLSNADFEHEHRGRRAGWWAWKPQAHALHYLWMTGQIAVHSRAHFQKLYDLAERVLPELFAAEPPEPETFRRWHLRQSLRAMGAATETDLRMYLTFPGITIAERRRTLAAMVREGEVVEIGVDGDGRRSKPERWLALSEDLPALARAGRRRAASRGTTLLSPFDSLLWHRERVRRLFGYDYKIEVYVPAPRRRHGYYSLPILHDGHLIGRLDPKTWREERRLEVRRVHFEPWFASGSPPPAAAWGRVERDAALGGLAGALVSLGTFVGAGRVTVGRVSPPALAAPLQRALRATQGR